MRAGLLLAMLVAVAASTGAAAPAAAQTNGDIPYIDAVEDWANGQSFRRLLPGSRDDSTGTTKPRKRGQRPKRPTARQLARLRFKSTRMITDQAYQAVIDLLEPGFDRAAVIEEFDRVKALVHMDMRALRGRWSPNNLGDLTAYLLVNSYAAFYSRTSVPGAGLEAVRRAARRDLASKGRIRRLSDARKQLAVEMLELRTIIRISDLNVGRMEGDVRRQRSARTSLRSWIKQAFGVDLEKVKLTGRGLLRR